MVTKKKSRRSSAKEVHDSLQSRVKARSNFIKTAKFNKKPSNDKPASFSDIQAKNRNHPI